MTKYKINLINQQQDSQKFWCFLSEPESDISSDVYANSNTYLTVPQYTGTQQNSFTIPLQYIVEVGASNNAVDLQTLITSNVTENTDLEVEWLASYYQEQGEKIGPTLDKSGDAPTGTLAVTTNAYDKSAESLNSWYGNMTYGVQSEDGFIGLTWSPDPSLTYEIKPKVAFYVAIGSYSSNQLADINAISSTAAEINEDDFDGNYECTVTLKTDGTWKVYSGKPQETSMSAYSMLLNAHLNLSSAHKTLVEMATTQQFVVAEDQVDESKSTGIQFDDSGKNADAANALITGSLTVATAIGVGFAYMLASGITLTITRRQATGTEFEFSYSGTAAKEAIQAAFAAGKEIFFTSNTQSIQKEMLQLLQS